MNAKIMFETAYMYDDEIWFTDFFSNRVYKYSLSNKKTTLEYVIDTEDCINRLFGGIICDKNYIYLIPFKAKYMHIIERKSSKTRHLSIPINGKFLDGGGKFLNAFLYNNKIVMVACTYSGIIIFNPGDDSFEEYNEWSKEIDKKSLIEDTSYFRKAMIDNGVVYAPVCKANIMLKFELESKKYSLIEVEKAEVGFSAVCKNGGKYYLSPRRGKGIIVLDSFYKKISSYKLPNGYGKSTEIADVISFDSKVLFLPQGQLHMVALEGDIIANYCINKRELGMSCRVENADEQCFFSAMTSRLYIAKGEEIDIRPIVCFDLVKNKESSIYQKYFFEEEDCSLKDFINGIR